jgi:hypothetical protein
MWYGHIPRMNEDRIPKKASNMKPKEKCARGMPRRRSRCCTQGRKLRRGFGKAETDGEARLLGDPHTVESTKGEDD